MVKMEKTSIKKLFAEAGVENAELENRVSEAFAGMENTDETMKRKNFALSKALSQRDEARDLVIERDVNIEGLNKKLDVSTGEIEGLNQYKDKIQKIEEDAQSKRSENWDKAKTVFDVKKGDKLFDKIETVKHRFYLDGELTPEQMDSNLKLIDTYNEVGYFEGKKESTNYNNGKPNRDGQETATGEFYGYDSVQQLAWKAPDLYEKWKKEQG